MILYGLVCVIHFGLPAIYLIIARFRLVRECGSPTYLSNSESRSPLETSIMFKVSCLFWAVLGRSIFARNTVHDQTNTEKQCAKTLDKHLKSGACQEDIAHSVMGTSAQIVSMREEIRQLLHVNGINGGGTISEESPMLAMLSEQRLLFLHVVLLAPHVRPVVQHERALVYRAGVHTVWTDGAGRHSSDPHHRRCGVGYYNDTHENNPRS
eukprot:1375898-Amphidinium_carterae.1